MERKQREEQLEAIVKRVDARILSKYNCYIDTNTSAFGNATRILGETHSQLVLSKLTNLAFHDLTDGKVPAGSNILLGLGQKFIPTPRFTTGIKEMNENLFRFRRDLYRATFWGDEEEKTAAPVQQPKVKLPSEWTPSESEIPTEVSIRVLRFFNELEKLYSKRAARSNLRPYELKLLKRLQEDVSIIIASADKGLGPVAVEIHKYIAEALKHLEDEEHYDIISSEEANSMTEQIVRDIDLWVEKYQPLTVSEKKRGIRRPNAGALMEEECKYIKELTHKAKIQSPNAVFYLLFKMHKDPIKTRPVYSTCGSIAEAIGKYVDACLRPIAQAQKSFFKDSNVLKKRLDKVRLPPNARLFTTDATAMYTNMDSKAVLKVLSDYLRKPSTMKQFDYNAECLIDAIDIVLRSNIIKFGDIFALQKKGVAMGICPAPSLAILFFAIHEDHLMSKWNGTIMFYLRFIDDVLGIWLSDSNPAVDDLKWKQFQDEMNAFYGLPWVFTPRSSSVEFMDLVITIEGDKLSTDLYEKPMALYLYVPPHSAHPRGGSNGLITGQMRRIMTLCSSETRIQEHTLNFLHRQEARGYDREDLIPLLEKAAKSARRFIQRSDEELQEAAQEKKDSMARCVRLHRVFHPDDPSASTIQQLFKEQILTPVDQTPLNELENLDKSKIPVDRLIICNHRAPNLGNLLSYRDIAKRKGVKVSTFLKKKPLPKRS